MPDQLEFFLTKYAVQELDEFIITLSRMRQLLCGPADEHPKSPWSDVMGVLDYNYPLAVLELIRKATYDDVFPHILLQIRDAERKVGLQLPDGPMDEEDAAPIPSDLKPTGHRASHKYK